MPSSTAGQVQIARLDERITGLERRLEERDKALAAALAATDKAVDKAEGAQLRVNASQNEFREELNAQSKSFVLRLELESMEKRVNALEMARAGGAGQSGERRSIKGDAFAVIALMISLGGGLVSLGVAILMLWRH